MSLEDIFFSKFWYLGKENLPPGGLGNDVIGDRKECLVRSRYRVVAAWGLGGGKSSGGKKEIDVAHS